MQVFKTAAKTALILVILDLLRLNKNSSWFEVRRRCEFRLRRCCRCDGLCFHVGPV